VTVVALSASYGAGGSQIAPALADLLGVPFAIARFPRRSPISWPSRSLMP
jgi:hypothetical protein